MSNYVEQMLTYTTTFSLLISSNHHHLSSLSSSFISDTYPFRIMQHIGICRSEHTTECD